MDKKPKDLIYFDEAVEFPKELKAMEDKIKAVLAECERLCPKESERVDIGDGITIYRMFAGKPQECFQFSANGLNSYVYLREDENKGDCISFHYRLLSLGVQSEKLLPNEIPGMIASKEEMLRHAGFVQSPAPDENGPPKEPWIGDFACSDGETYDPIAYTEAVQVWQKEMEAWNTRAHAPIQKPQDWEATKHVIFNGIEDAYAKGRLDGLVMTYIMEFLEPKLDSLLAPSAGKDQISSQTHVDPPIAGIVVAYDEEKTRLVNALEEIARLLDDSGMACNDARYGAFVKAKQALAAYKGKEAKEGGNDGN